MIVGRNGVKNKREATSFDPVESVLVPDFESLPHKISPQIDSNSYPTGIWQYRRCKKLILIKHRFKLGLQVHRTIKVTVVTQRILQLQTSPTATSARPALYTAQALNGPQAHPAQLAGQPPTAPLHLHHAHAPINIGIAKGCRHCHSTLHLLRNVTGVGHQDGLFLAGQLAIVFAAAWQRRLLSSSPIQLRQLEVSI